MNTVFNEPNGRSVINDLQSKTGYIRRQQWTAPLAANATKILSAHALDGTTVTTFAGQPDYARNAQIVASGAATGNVVITGTNIRGDVISETIALNGATPVIGLHAFKTITSIVLPTVGATTINVGTGVKLGLDRRMAEASVIDAYADGVREATAATVNPSAATTSLNTITTNTAPNGTKNFSAYFMSTELTDKNGAPS